MPRFLKEKFKIQTDVTKKSDGLMRMMIKKTNEEVTDTN